MYLRGKKKRARSGDQLRLGLSADVAQEGYIRLFAHVADDLKNLRVSCRAGNEQFESQVRGQSERNMQSLCLILVPRCVALHAGQKQQVIFFGSRVDVVRWIQP